MTGSWNKSNILSPIVLSLGKLSPFGSFSLLWVLRWWLPLRYVYEWLIYASGPLGEVKYYFRISLSPIIPRLKTSSPLIEYCCQIKNIWILAENFSVHPLDIIRLTCIQHLETYFCCSDSAWNQRVFKACNSCICNSLSKKVLQNVLVKAYYVLNLYWKNQILGRIN